MDRFAKRVYGGPGELLRDTRAIMGQRHLLRATMRGALSPALRERLMLTVTAVNGCRYCSYAHARQALSEGISPEEIRALGDMAFQDSPPEEVAALLYAQHWAETDGEPDAAARSAVVERYGEDMVERMEIVLRMIRVGNLLGNTWDYILYRLSFGRLGRSRGTSA